ncbi:MAG: class I tRNA ligase family protein [Verrucomicrobiota bacterium]
MSKAFYLTTAIDYVNGEPHLGHAYEKVVTDVIARAHRSLGQPVFFLTGLDEHGQKVQQVAEAQGKTPQAYCDELAAIWKRFTQTLTLSNDDFVRTTERRHEAFVQAVLAKFLAEGRLYKAEYRGFYSSKEETFLTDRDRLPDGTFDPSWGKVVELAEENYYFKLQQDQPWLIDYIESHPDFVAPDYRRNEVLGFLKNNQLEDLCVTRPAARLTWGIPLPFDQAYVTYVWFDALLNYASVPAGAGDPAVLKAMGSYWQPPADAPSRGLELWPPDVQVIGKDIIKFHAIYWPIFLKALGLALPRQILAHGFWQKDGQKISKSLGNIVDPVAVINEWGVDAFRFYVTRELDIGPDGNWTDAGFQARYQAELANGLGNLVNRSLAMLRRYRQGVVPAVAADLRPDAEAAVQATRAHLEKHELQAALLALWKLINRANQYIDQTAPFKLAKDPSQSARLDQILYTLAETCRVLAVLISPFLPTTASRIYAQLDMKETPDKLRDAAWGLLSPGHVVSEPSALFPRKDLPAPKS